MSAVVYGGAAAAILVFGAGLFGFLHQRIANGVLVAIILVMAFATERRDGRESS